MEAHETFGSLYAANDDGLISEIERERLLTESFHHLGYHPVFVDHVEAE